MGGQFLMVEVPHHICGSFGILTVEQYLFWTSFCDHEGKTSFLRWSTGIG